MKKMSVFTLAAVTCCLMAQANFSHDIKSEKRPWTHENFLDSPDEFHFAIVSDRTGGHRPGIFPDAMKKLNMLRPEFVICVGDLIEGINKPHECNHDNMRKQWKEIRSYTESLEMPFFYVVGNHDISRTRPGFPKANNIATDVWEENFGKNTTYYSFIYKNVLFICLNLQEGLDDRKPQVIFTEPQYQWTVETLKKHPDVRWTMIFVHSPYHWDYPNFIRLEKFLKEENRKYTVFSGDWHQYIKFRRHNRNYYALGTTGGVIDSGKMRGPKYGEMDHVMWVTMTKKGPVCVNLLLDGILADDVVTEETNIGFKQYKKNIPRTENTPKPVKEPALTENAPQGTIYSSNFDTEFKDWTNRKQSKKVIAESKNGKLLLTGDVNNRYKTLTITKNLPVFEQGKDYKITITSTAAVSKAAIAEDMKKSVLVRIRSINKDGKTLNYHGSSLKMDTTAKNSCKFTYTPPVNAVQYQLYVDWTNFTNNDLMEIEKIEITTSGNKPVSKSMVSTPPVSPSSDNIVMK